MSLNSFKAVAFVAVCTICLLFIFTEKIEKSPTNAISYETIFDKEARIIFAGQNLSSASTGGNYKRTSYVVFFGTDSFNENNYQILLSKLSDLGWRKIRENGKELFCKDGMLFDVSKPTHTTKKDGIRLTQFPEKWGFGFFYNSSSVALCNQQQ